jgi:hypothetical protein
MGSLSVAFFYITPPARTVLFFYLFFFSFLCFASRLSASLLKGTEYEKNDLQRIATLHAK